MTDVISRFSEILEGLLADRAGEFDLDGGECTPASARRAAVPEGLIAEAVAGALGLEYCKDLDSVTVSGDFLRKIPIAYARRHYMVGFSGENGDNGEMTVAVADPQQLQKLDNVARILDRKLHVIVAPGDEIVKTINSAYQQQTGQAEKVIEQLDRDEILRDVEKAASAPEDLLDVASRAPVIKLVNLALFEAVKRRASDLHVHPYEDKLVIRMRIDGVLHDIYLPPLSLHSEIISRIKVMGGMDIAERRLPQDGRTSVEVGDRRVDLRISTLPTSFGERAVIRLLDKSARLYRLTDLGMSRQVMEAFGRLIHSDHGIILVTGPTGSGKTTTLYSALGEINSTSLNILTLEDPIEYRLEGISQTQVSEKKGMTFASGLRTVLRQDPDIIMVGEVRDGETARMAIQSALTGHLVFSTLHTNDAAGAVARLLDLGVEPYLLASSLLGVLAQRLVRRICGDCAEWYEPCEEELASLGEDPDGNHTKLCRGRGCDSCLDTGYRERIGIFELLTVSEAIREDILRTAKASTIKEHAVSEGMQTLRADGLIKARKGMSTIEEVMRVTGRDEF